MTLYQINKTIQKIKTQVNDPEAAHSLEDDLYLDFILYIAKGGDKDLAKKAKRIMSVQKMNFPRWAA